MHNKNLSSALSISTQEIGAQQFRIQQVTLGSFLAGAAAATRAATIFLAVSSIKKRTGEKHPGRANTTISAKNAATATMKPWCTPEITAKFFHRIFKPSASFRSPAHSVAPDYGIGFVVSEELSRCSPLSRYLQKWVSELKGIDQDADFFLEGIAQGFKLVPDILVVESDDSLNFRRALNKDTKPLLDKLFEELILGQIQPQLK